MIDVEVTAAGMAFGTLNTVTEGLKNSNTSGLSHTVWNYVWFWDAIYRDRWNVVQQCWIRFHSFTNIVEATHAHNTMHCWSQHCWELIVASVRTPPPTRTRQLNRITFAPARKPYRKKFKFTHKKSDFGAISVTVTERSCIAPISKVEHLIG